MTTKARTTARAAAARAAATRAAATSRTRACALALAAVLGHGGAGRADTGGEPAGAAPRRRHEIDVSIAGGRLMPAESRFDTQPEAGWGLGLALGYGYFARPWLRLDAQAQLDAAIYAEDRVISSWALGGASLCYDLGRERGAGLLFAGLRLGAGFTREGDSDGGLPQIHRALVAAPRVGVLLRLTDRLGLHAYAEYQGVYVPTDTKYEYGSRHILRVPIGVTATF